MRHVVRAHACAHHGSRHDTCSSCITSITSITSRPQHSGGHRCSTAPHAQGSTSRRAACGSTSSRGASTSGRTAASGLLHSLEPLAIDVEYAHVALADGSEKSVPAWVCVVGTRDQGAPLLKVHCRHPLLDAHQAAGADGGAGGGGGGGRAAVRSIGGVRLGELGDAAALVEAAARVWALWQGHALVGHGLAKDLRALGLSSHMASMPCYDTLDFKGFQNSGGNARALRRLAKDLLGVEIHTKGGGTHDPEVDARVVLDLYTLHARPVLMRTTASFEDVVAFETAQALRRAADARARLRVEEEEGEEE
ncbi:hypothetical protein FOA52_014670 [Chlamydomonas sp. UWO 241]|nr:hypothetical protein FOA52_014670 [Chlamydomonas sp. UWO 241]